MSDKSSVTGTAFADLGRCDMSGDIVPACPHCGPAHFAGPNADGTCAMCGGDLIRTDAAGAAAVHEFYNDAVGNYAEGRAAEQAAAALAAAEKRGAARERAAIAADLRVWAEQGGDPWMSYVAAEVEAGHRPEPETA